MGVRERFVREILEDEGRRLYSYQTAAIQRRTVSRSGRLLSGRSVSVQAGGDYDGVLSLQHPAYERFLDLARIRRGKTTVRSAKKIHNRYVFGAYSSIAARLMNDLTEDVAARLSEATDD